jgi:membrane fusion protein, multidrug efflux system
MKSKTKVWIVAILGLLGVVGILAGVKIAQIMSMIRAGKAFVPPPESVSSAEAEATSWELKRDAIGSLVAERAVTLSTELPGTVRQISFDSGTSVKRGTVLVKLDTSTEEAQLAAAASEAALDRLTLERTERLRQSAVVPKADLDMAQARATEADATAQALRATIAKKTIRAPFDGRISIRQIEIGQVLSPGQPIATLQSVSPIHAEFWLPQRALAELAVGQHARMRTDAFPTGAWEGKLTTINPEIDPATRNVRLRATFDNPDGRLRPGMYASVEVLAPEQGAVLAIPATAVLYAPYGDSVFVLERKADSAGKEITVARQQFVRLGERRGDFVAVTSGLSPGEAVASSGAFKLRNGAAVLVNNALAPHAELDPLPTEP